MDRIREFIRTNIAFAPDLEYDALITVPAAALETRFASPRAQDILFVAICRALGVPARLNPIDSQPEYYSNGAFLPPHPRTANLAITASGVNPKYFEDFTIARLSSGGYVSLDLTGVPLGTAVPVLPGDYRILTSNRLPNGDVHMSALAVSLLPDERKSVELHFFAATTEEMLGDCSFSDFSLSSGESLSSITEGGAILMRLEPGAVAHPPLLEVDRAAPPAAGVVDDDVGLDAVVRAGQERHARPPAVAHDVLRLRQVRVEQVQDAPALRLGHADDV